MNNNDKGTQFEIECFNWLKKQGFSELEHTRKTGDYGADITGFFGGSKYVIECKAHEETMNNNVVAKVVSSKAIYKANRAIVISKSCFTKQAQYSAKKNWVLLLTEKDFEKDFETLRQNFWANAVDVDTPDDHLKIVAMYEKEKAVIGEVPNIEQLSYALRDKIKKNYKKYWDFLSTIGDKSHFAKPDKEQLKEEYMRVKKEINRRPTLEDIGNNSEMSKDLFKSYPFTKLQKDCGDSPVRNMNVTKEQLLEAYKELSEKIGYNPTAAENDEKGKYKSVLYRRRWGTFTAFLDAHGFKSTPRVDIKRKQYKQEDFVEILKNIETLLKKTKNVDKLNRELVLGLTLKGKRLITREVLDDFGGWNKVMQLLED